MRALLNEQSYFRRIGRIKEDLGVLVGPGLLFS